MDGNQAALRQGKPADGVIRAVVRLVLVGSLLGAGIACGGGGNGTPPPAGGGQLRVVNAGFEDRGTRTGVPRGWRKVPAKADEFELATDADVKRDGEASARLRSTADDATTATAEQCVNVAESRGKVLRIVGALRTDDVKRRAALTLNVRPTGGGTPLVTTEAVLRATNDWSERTLAALVPDGATRACFGFMLAGPGTAWADSFSITAS